MIPTSIDGTDITGATIDGTDVSEITVDGQTVFTAGGPPIENFETGNLNNYNSDPVFSVQSSDVFEGGFAMETSGGNGDIFTNNPPSGTVATFGTDFEIYFKLLGSNSRIIAFYETDGSDIGADGLINGYGFEMLGDRFRAFGSTSSFADGISAVDDTFTVRQNIWYRVTATFSGGTVTYKVIDTTTNNIVASVSHGSFNSPGTGIGFGARDDL